MIAMLEREVDMDSSDTALSNRKRFLFAHWEGGGNTPPMLAVVRRLIGRGHEVRVLSDPCNREEVEATGASFVSWTRAPRRENKSPASDPLRDWELKTPPALLRRLCDQFFVGTALPRAQDVLAELKRFEADAIVTGEMLLGVMAAAEAAHVPCAALCANVYLFPLPGVPPFGPGLQPAKTWVGRLLHKFVAKMTMKVFGEYSEAFNATRQALGLESISHPFDQIARVDRVLVQTSPAFDFPATSLPRNVVYVGPEIGDPDWVEPWRSPWNENESHPLVLVGFSSTYQDQSAVLRRVIAALGGLDVRAVVTAGPSIDVESLEAPRNVHVCRSAPHSQLLKQASLVITHAGHGTVIRALAAGVPLVCMPMGRDQNDNAARVTARQAGVRISPKASARAIRHAVLKVLENPAFHEGAQRLGARIAYDAEHSPAVEILEQVAARSAAAARI
ncbi:MAG TPA: glycosyltransferase [Humisphaera sp.]|nr:glycosyltransferase [Humisphaera sp.]